MSTTQKALDQVQTRHLPYWKLYRGNDRVAQCDREENPNADPELALELFERELSYLADEPGQYKVNVYRAINGEKGGFKYSFTIFQSEKPMNTFRSNRTDAGPLNDSLYDILRRDIERDLTLKRIEEKLDGIIAVIAARATDGKDDDDKAFEFIKTLAGAAVKQKLGMPAKSGGFSNL